MEHLDAIDRNEYQTWNEHVERTQDLTDLIEFARSALKTDAAVCTCLNASCLACRVSAIVAKRSA